MNKITTTLIFLCLFFKLAAQSIIDNIFSIIPEGCHYITASPIEDGKCQEGEYVLVFEDEFTGSQIDKEKWNTQYGYGARCNAGDNQVYLDENIEVKDGILSLKLNERPGIYICGSGIETEHQFASGMIWSKSSYLYGIFEAEIRIPNGSNFWPAFWLWNTEGEIDVFEFYDDETAPEFSIHKWPEEVHEKCTYVHKGQDYSTDYHKYTLVWEKYFIALYIDGDLKYVHWLWYTIDGKSGINCTNLNANQLYLVNGPYPSQNQEEYVILNLAVQNDGAPNPVPAEMNIKYVRVWQKKTNICVDKTIGQYNSETIEGRTITIDNGFVLPTGSNISITASESILFNSGISIELGSSFQAFIKPNICYESIEK